MADQSFLTDILAPITGTKPGVAPWRDIQLSDAQLQSILSNIQNWDQMIRLSDLYTEYVQRKQTDILGPEWANIVTKGVGTTGQMYDIASNWMKGQLSPETTQQIAQSAAYQSLRAGTAGGGIGTALTPRSIGLGVEAQQQKGAALAGQAGNAAQLWSAYARGLQLDPRAMFISPQEQFEAMYANQLQQQRVEQQKLNLAAAPDPGWRFLSDLVAYETGQYLGSMGGGGMGGMGGGKGGGAGLGLGTNFNDFGLNSYYGEGSGMSQSLGPVLEQGWGSGGGWG